MPNETIHAQFNYITTSTLFGQDPLGTPFNGDNNGDGVIKIWKLWRIADVSPIMTSDPQLGNAGGLAKLIYIDEGLQFNNATLPSSIEYRVDNFNINNTTIIKNSNVMIDIDQNFNATGTFNAQLRATLNIHP